MNKINFQITGSCNLNCGFCCDAVYYQKESSIKNIKEMVDRIPNDEVDEIHITGGEPLMYQNLKEILSYIKERGFKVSLSTNGILLLEKKELLPYIDEIILPLDGVNAKTLEDMGRDSVQMLNTIKNICMLTEQFPNTRITINTVVTKQNKQEIMEVLDVMRLLIFDEWRIHQFLPHGAGRENIRTFLLDDREFDRMITELQTTEIGEKIVPLPVSEKIDTEWTITPNLRLIKLKDERPAFYGKIEDMNDREIHCLLAPRPQYIKRPNHQWH